MVEHDACVNCKYEKYDAWEEPCNKCRYTKHFSEFNTTPDLYEPKFFEKENGQLSFIEPSKDVIHHPDHYCSSRYEPKDVIRAWGLNFNLGNVVKYICRAGHKDGILQELNKAKRYLEFEIEAIEEERKNADSEALAYTE